MHISRYPLMVQPVVPRHSIFRVLRSLPGLMALSIAVVAWSAEPDICDYASRTEGVWTIEVIDVVSPNQTLYASRSTCCDARTSEPKSREGSFAHASNEVFSG